MPLPSCPNQRCWKRLAGWESMPHKFSSDGQSPWETFSLHTIALRKLLQESEARFVKTHEMLSRTGEMGQRFAPEAAVNYERPHNTASLLAGLFSMATVCLLRPVPTCIYRCPPSLESQYSFFRLPGLVVPAYINSCVIILLGLGRT